MNELLAQLRALRAALSHPMVSAALLLAGLVVAGFVAIGLAWRGVAATPYVPLQLPWVISGGVAGLGLIGVGLALLDTHVTRAMGAERRLRHDALLREAVALLVLVRRQDAADDGSRELAGASADRR